MSSLIQNNHPQGLKDMILPIFNGLKAFKGLPRQSHNLNRGEKALIADNLLGACHYVYDHYLKYPYQDMSPNDYEYSIVYDGQTVYRPNHALAHTLRVVSYLPTAIDHFKSSHAIFDISYEDMQKTQVALLFAVVGRGSEVSHSDDTQLYLSYVNKSAKAFEAYANSAECCIKFTPKEILEFKERILTFGNPSTKETLATLMRVCHKLDLQRCYSQEQIEASVYEPIAAHIGHHGAQVLIAYAKDCIKQTGDRNYSDWEGYNYPVYVASNTDVEVCLNNIAIARQLNVEQHPMTNLKQKCSFN